MAPFLVIVRVRVVVERQPALTYEEVCDAANLLHREGHHVTIDALHARLARGSKTTIHKHRERWRREMQDKLKDGEEEVARPAPDPLKAFFETTFSELWQAALEAAHGTLAALREDAERTIANAHAQIEKANEQAQSAQRESAMHFARITTLDEKLERVMRELSDERQQRTAQEVTAAAEARSAAQRIAELETALVKANGREAQLREQTQALVMKLEDKIQHLQQRHAEAEQQARIIHEDTRREAAHREQALQRALKLAQSRALSASVAWHNKEKTWIETKSKLEQRLEGETKESSRLGKALVDAQLRSQQLEEKMHLADRERVGLQEAGAVLNTQLADTQRQSAKLELQVQHLLGDNARLNEQISQAMKELSERKS